MGRANAGHVLEFDVAELAVEEPCVISRTASSSCAGHRYIVRGDGPDLAQVGGKCL